MMPIALGWPLISMLIAPVFMSSALWENLGPRELLAEAEKAIALVESYTAIFHKQELFDGVLNEEETISIKFKKPFCVYLKWIKKPFKGRECLYVQGFNNNRIKAHEGGLLGLVKVNLNPLSSRAMKGNRHPITEFGLENLVKRIRQEFERGASADEVQLKDLGLDMTYGRRTRRIEAIFPKDRGYFCCRAVVDFDCELKIPIKTMIYNGQRRLMESYGFEELKLNAGLNDFDFDPRNPAYNF